jgi:DNA-binding NarL/FixJ family response regulator
VICAARRLLYALRVTIRVVVADDNLLVREGIQHVLADVASIDVVALSEDRDALLDAIEREGPDVVLTDIRMPPSQASEGIDIANSVRDLSPAIGVIVISAYAEPHYALSLFAHGSAGRGYLLKDRLGNREQLVAAIEEVAAGGSVIDPVVVEAIVRSKSGSEESPVRLLTPREHEVLAEIASGKSNAAIAKELVITKRAVERHISSIFSKLDLPAEEIVSRRVAATLLYLADRAAATDD